jgi:DNA primase large subunit
VILKFFEKYLETPIPTKYFHFQMDLTGQSVRVLQSNPTNTKSTNFRGKRATTRTFQKPQNQFVYKHVVSMYRKDPFEMNSGVDSEISLEKVEQLMMSRYKALLVLDSLAATHQKHSEDYREELRKRLLKIDNDEQKLGSIFTGQFHAQAIKTEKVQLDLLDDNWSHFLLRLAYSRSDELRKWFLEYEVDLFKFRMATQTGYGLDISKFMEIENLDFEKVEINPEMAQFINSKETKCYKVSWTRVLPLVKTRNVYLRDGWAFVTVENVQDILVDEFKSHLQKQLAKGARHWSNNGLSDEENRLVPIFNFFTTRNSQGYTSSNADGTLTAQNMDEVAEQNYPMCMMSMHKHWRQFHHLKHQARLYYWRFLKQAGMPLEDALEVFRTLWSTWSNLHLVKWNVFPRCTFFELRSVVK